jgi:hypothetical protein
MADTARGPSEPETVYQQIYLEARKINSNLERIATGLERIYSAIQNMANKP